MPVLRAKPQAPSSRYASEASLEVGMRVWSGPSTCAFPAQLGAQACVGGGDPPLGGCSGGPEAVPSHRVLDQECL